MQIAASGADVRPIPGTRQDVTEAALAATGESFYASHNWQPFFIEGTKTLAFELWEQLGFRVPDNILVPTGYGSNILGLERGFDELERGGEIAARPRLFAVQAANCAAFAAAWAAGADRFVPFAAEPTVADGIATPKPVRIAEVLAALRRSRGGVVAVAEEEIAPALAALGRLGLFVEPTAATAGAALTRLLVRRDDHGGSDDRRRVDRLWPEGRRPDRRASPHRRRDMIEIRPCMSDDAVAVSTLLGELGYAVSIRQAKERVAALSKTGQTRFFSRSRTPRSLGFSQRICVGCCNTQARSCALRPWWSIDGHAVVVWGSC